MTQQLKEYLIKDFVIDAERSFSDNFALFKSFKLKKPTAGRSSMALRRSKYKVFRCSIFSNTLGEI